MIIAIPLGIDLLTIGITAAFAAPGVYETGKAIVKAVDANKKKGEQKKNKK